MTLRVLVAMLVVGGPLATSGHAQEIRAAAIRAESSHELLGAPAGFSLDIGGRPTPWLGVRAGIQYGRDRFSSIGGTCSGLVAPDEECGPELRRETATTIALWIGLPLTRSLGWGEVGVVPSLRRLSMRSEQVGTASGRARGASEVAYGFGLGLELALQVAESPATGLHIGAHAARHPWFDREIVADGYSPFTASTRLSWIELGIGVRLPRNP